MKNFILGCFLFCLASQAIAEIAVITNVQNNQVPLTRLQVQDIFMGRMRAFPNGQFATTYDQTTLRDDFYQQLTQRPIAQINAYWARLMFSGQTSPPIKLTDDQSVIKAIQENIGAIGYINKKNASHQAIRILFILK